MRYLVSPGRLMASRLVAAGIAASISFAGLSALTAAPAHAEDLLSETFTGGSTPADQWLAPSPKGTHKPCLTAAAAEPPKGSIGWCNAAKEGKVKADPEGQGAFQITDNSANDAGGLILNQNLDARKGLHIEFDLFQYNSANGAKGADGISFFLIDGDVASPTVGEPGGGLGYYGLEGGIVGVGFDEFGNFSNKEAFGGAAAGGTGVGKRPNSVVIRGSQSTKYKYVDAVTLPKGQDLAVPAAKTREEARRTVNVDISTAGLMNVYMAFKGGEKVQKILKNVDLNKIPGQAELPDRVKLGFAASTGGANAYHELQNFKVSVLNPNLKTTVVPLDAPWNAGGTGTFEINVENQGGDGPTNGPITTKFTAPEGTTVTSAEGDGWNCKTAGQDVTCSRSDVLKPGSAAPPVKVALAIARDAATPLALQATADVPNEHKAADNTSQPVSVEITPASEKGPDLATGTKPDGPFKAGGTGTSTTLVGDAPDAGPTTGKTTVTIPAAAGTTIVNSSGDGWECSTADDGSSSTCTREDVLQPGAVFPPIKTVYDVPAEVKGPLEVGSTVDTPGDGNADNNTSDPSTVEVTPPTDGPAPVSGPDLTTVVDGSGNFVPGGSGTITATVANDAKAGPTTGDTTVTIPIPSGLTADTAEGDGWKCEIGEEAVTCTRSDVLAPGASFPPVKVGVTGGPGVKAPLAATASVSTPGDTDKGNDNADPASLPKPGLQVGMSVTPEAFKSGDKLAYTITVTNTGDKSATDAELRGVVAQVWRGVPWTCTATDGSTCPAEAGKGDITAKVTVAPGGKVTFTAECAVPSAVAVPLMGSAVVKLADDANCADGCSVEARSTPAAARLNPFLTALVA